MIQPRFWFRLALLSFGLLEGVPLLHAGEEVLLDLCAYHRDPNGSSSRPYEYAFGEWNKHVLDFNGRGTLIKAPNGKGGIGENKTSLEPGKSALVDLQFVIGNGNKAAAINLSLEDRDGTEQSWAVPLEGAAGQLVRVRLDLSKPTTETKPGTTAGLNLKKLNTWQIRGDWSDRVVEVLLVKLTAAK
ncbi:MAG: hypothetical protein ABIZ04_09810 [Opitutus sp.]